MANTFISIGCYPEQERNSSAWEIERLSPRSPRRERSMVVWAETASFLRPLDERGPKSTRMKSQFILPKPHEGSMSDSRGLSTAPHDLRRYQTTTTVPKIPIALLCQGNKHLLLLTKADSSLLFKKGGWSISTIPTARVEGACFTKSSSPSSLFSPSNELDWPLMIPFREMGWSPRRQETVLLRQSAPPAHDRVANMNGHQEFE
ncbi:hypothetical protein MHU86_23753 [Fragilaria crotonensis]|nr:hypothetical protein MHU86_23753 [Fragilaria crotonensis]